MFYYFSIVLYVLALAYNIKLVRDCIKCKGKEPPFISSLGKIKKETLSEARSFLQKKKGIKVTDLGCGSGCLLLPLAKEFKDSEFVGYEYDWLAYTIAKIRTCRFSNITIYKKNFFEADLSEYKLVLCYLSTDTAIKIGDKLNKELPKEALVFQRFLQFRQ